MNEPRRWTLAYSPTWDYSSGHAHFRVDGPALDIYEEVEVIEIGPGVIIDTLGEGIEHAVFFSPPKDLPRPSIRRIKRINFGRYRITIERRSHLG